MSIDEYLATLTPVDRTRLLGQIEGMQLAQRIIQNRVIELVGLGASDEIVAELHGAQTLLRSVQVGLGNGARNFPTLTVPEQAAIDRIS
ncbi:MAG: hypothetical protein JWR25_2162 [Noviherbaspirillum sp.]|jgi:hypothetical protein|nr:hypothetical protein [Noviherbaspirillum sp.]